MDFAYFSVIGLIVILMMVLLFVYMRKYHGAKSHHDGLKETCRADISPMLLEIEEKKTPEHHAHNAVGPSEANQVRAKERLSKLDRWSCETPKL